MVGTFCSSFNLYNQHGVAVRVEAVSLLDSMVISIENFLKPGEGSYQSEQGGSGQMKIRDHRVGHFKGIAGHNEQIRLALLSA